jgi:hypothetical protein
MWTNETHGFAEIAFQQTGVRAPQGAVTDLYRRLM